MIQLYYKTLVGEMMSKLVSAEAGFLKDNLGLDVWKSILVLIRNETGGCFERQVVQKLKNVD